MRKYIEVRLLFATMISIVSIQDLSAQQLTPFIVSTSGGFYSNSSGLLSFTTGEMASVETYTAPFTILTQGFQQTWDFGTYTTDHANENFSFGIYPNPSPGHFSLVTETEKTPYVVMRILDLFGREILTTSFYQQTQMHIHPVELTKTATGMYMIALTVKESPVIPEYQFVTKIQIIQ